MRTPLVRQRGIALITAVLVVAIAVIAATAAQESGYYAIQRTATVQDSEMAWGYASGAEDWVRTILDRTGKAAKHTSLDQPWAEPQTLPVENGAITGAIFDATARFNLNNLGESSDQAQPNPNGGAGAVPLTPYQQQVQIFTNLIQNIEGGPQLISNPQDLADSIRDWIDSDQIPTNSGREDTDYLSLEPPHRAANRAMATVTELRQVLDALYGQRTDDARKIYQLLLPHVTALPVKGVTPINVNTADLPLLLALDPKGPGSTELAEFAQTRLKKPLTDAGKIATTLNLTSAMSSPQLVGVSSRLFELHLQAVVGQGRVALYSLIFRPSQGMPVVLQRSTDSE